MSYQDTFIQVADDCPVETAVIPTLRGKSKSIHLIQYELLSKNPYQFDHEALIFEVYVQRNNISETDLAKRREELWNTLFKKEHPCMRASALKKKYGWGAHYDAEGKIALYGMDSVDYHTFLKDENCKQLMAMRSKRKK